MLYPDLDEIVLSLTTHLESPANVTSNTSP